MRGCFKKAILCRNHSRILGYQQPVTAGHRFLKGSFMRQSLAIRLLAGTALAFLVGSTSPWLLGQCRVWFGSHHGLSYGFAGLAAAYLVGAAAVALARVTFFERDRLVEEQ